MCVTFLDLFDINSLHKKNSPSDIITEVFRKVVKGFKLLNRKKNVKKGHQKNI